MNCRKWTKMLDSKIKGILVVTCLVIILMGNAEAAGTLADLTAEDLQLYPQELKWQHLQVSRLEAVQGGIASLTGGWKQYFALGQRFYIYNDSGDTPMGDLSITLVPAAWPREMRSAPDYGWYRRNLGASLDEEKLVQTFRKTNNINTQVPLTNLKNYGWPSLYYFGGTSLSEAGVKDTRSHIGGYAKGYFLDINIGASGPQANQATPEQMVKLFSPWLSRLPDISRLQGPVNGTEPIKSKSSKSTGPLTPKDIAMATAASGLLLSLGTLLQLLNQGGGSMPNPGNKPFGGSSGGPPVNEKGQVFYKPPWDKGGAYWMDRKEYDTIKRMEGEGKRWDDKWGWVDDATLRERQANDQAWRAGNEALNRKNQEELAKIRATQEAIKASKENMATKQKIAELWNKQHALEDQAAKAAAEAERLETIGKVAEAVQFAADNSINVLSGFAGPAGDAFRRGYYVVKGAAGGLGEAIADGGDIIKHVAKGAGRGALEAAADYGAEKALQGMGALKNRLLDESSAVPISAELGRTKTALKGALSTVDPEQRAVNIRKLYQNGGMQNLAELEGAGHLTAQQVQECNRIITADVEGAIHQGTQKTVSEFSERTGVSISEVLVGDSGSSAQKALNRSINSDADRTLVASFKRDDLVKYADAHCGGDLTAAHNELSEAFTKMHQQSVDSQLNKVGLTAGDVDYKSYNRLGSHSGQADSYADGFTYTRQSVQGQTTVYKFDDAGGLKHSYKTSGQTLLDQEALNVRSTTGELPDMTPKIGTEEYPDLVQMQQKSLAKHDDAKSVAKALERTNYTGERMGNPLDDTLMKVAGEIRKNPTDTAKILEANSLTKEDFYNQACQAVDSYASWLSKARGE